MRLESSIKFICSHSEDILYIYINMFYIYKAYMQNMLKDVKWLLVLREFKIDFKTSQQ